MPFHRGRLPNRPWVVYGQPAPQARPALHDRQWHPVGVDGHVQRLEGVRSRSARTAMMRVCPADPGRAEVGTVLAAGYGAVPPAAARTRCLIILPHAIIVDDHEASQVLAAPLPGQFFDPVQAAARLPTAALPGSEERVRVLAWCAAHEYPALVSPGQPGCLRLRTPPVLRILERQPA